LQLAASKNYYANDTLRTNITAFSFKDSSGFTLNELKGNFKIDSNRIDAKDFVLKTPNSSLTATATIFPASFINSKHDKDEQPVNDIVLNKTIIGSKDLELLAAGITKQYQQQIAAIGNMLVDARITGNARQWLIKKLTLHSTKADVVSLQLSGIVNNATDKKHLQYNLNIQHATVAAAVIKPFIQNSKQPINLPPVITVKGTAAGNMQTVNTNLTAISAYGMAAVKGRISSFTDVQKLTYDVVITAKDLETGKWIQQDSVLGKLTGTIAAKGAGGFDIKNNNMQVDANIASFRYQKTVSPISKPKQYYKKD